jgi:hypothetical protein
MLLKKRLIIILVVAALMMATMAASAVPAFALNPQPIPPGVHGDYFSHNVSDPGVT